MPNFKILASVINKLVIAAMPENNRKSTGSVTAEFAVVIPAFLLLLVIVGSFFSLSVEQLRLNDVAYMSARAASRGEQQTVIEYHAGKIMGKEVVLETVRESGILEVRISSQGKVLSLPWLSVRLQATQKILVGEKLVR